MTQTNFHLIQNRVVICKVIITITLTKLLLGSWSFLHSPTSLHKFF